MQLNHELIPAWVRWQQPEGSEAGWDEAAERLRRQAAQDPDYLKNRLVALDETGQIQASLFLSMFQPGVLSFGALRCGPEVAGEVLIELVRQASAHSHSLGARLHCRLPATPQLAPLLAALPALGAHLSHTRLEFWARLADLPEEADSPLDWQAIEPLGPYSLAAAAEILAAAGQGDPDWDPADDPLTLLESYLADEVLTSGPECVQIAHVQGQPAGIVIAQVNLSTAWSRITYMGLLPAFRGQGLGKWIHRRGFAMLRAQGGQEYHGGTVQGNTAMEALFRRHGCQLEHSLQEWHWDLPA